MTRSRISPIKQPDDNSCGPAALKTALAMLGKRASVSALIDLCKTNKNGTTTRNMLSAIKHLKLSSLVVEKTTLNHLLSALRSPKTIKRAVLVSYLYHIDKNDQVDPDSGHWAVVSSYKPASGRIVLLDSYTGQKISYPWSEFRRRWVDKKLKKRKITKRGVEWKFIKKPEKQLMIVVSQTADSLPKFRIPTARIMTPRRVN